MAAQLPLHLHLRPETRSPATSVGGGWQWTPGALSCCNCGSSRALRSRAQCAPASKEDTQLAKPPPEEEASPEDLECVRQIKRVLDLLQKNRDMIFSEVKLTIMIEDPRDVERKRLMGIDPDEITRDDLAAALEDVHEGRIPENRVALRMLAEEISSWPNLDVETTKKKRTKSMYAKATDTGVDPAEAARRLNIDWDAAAEIDGEEEADELEVPPAVGYGALYLVTALPILIGISVVLILFYNSLQ